MNPKDIILHFNHAAPYYDDLTEVQYQSAKQLIAHYRHHYPQCGSKSILDVGTGTGYMPQQLRPYFTDAQFYLNDIAPNMLKHCQAKFNSPLYHPLLGDIDHIAIPKVDLITSNFSLQWSQDISKTMTKLAQHSKKLAISFLLPGTFSEWYDLLQTQPLMNYPGLDALKSHLFSLDQDAHLYIKSFEMKFKHPKAFLQYLHQMGAAASEIKVPIKTLKSVIGLNHPFTTKYVVLFAIFKGQSCMSL